MKIGIVTHYGVHNHGAILQLTGLINVLKSLGHDAHALSFDKNYDFLGKELKAKYNIGVNSIGIYLKYLHQEGVKKTLYNFNKRHILNRFKCDMHLIGPYYTEGGEYDVVVIGSDEVFALHTGPTPLFFGHAAPASKVISYAGSFGPTTITDITQLHCEQFVKSGIENMAAISVRDMNSQNIITSLTGKTPALVCDPVILYGFHKEIQAGSKMNGGKRYLLVYAYDNRMNEPHEIAAIKAYANAHKLEIISPGFYHSWANKNVNCNPVELLHWFKSAQCVITDTFHGSVMSIITGAPMVVKTRDNSNKVVNLLKEYGLDGRIITSFDEIAKKMSAPIDWHNVNTELEQRRNAAMTWLNNALL